MKTTRSYDLGEPLNVFPALLSGCTIPGAGQDKSFNHWQNILSLVPRADRAREMLRARATRSFCQISGVKDVSTSLSGLADVLMKSLAGGTTAQR